MSDKLQLVPRSSQGHGNASLLLAHHHTCSQQGPSSAIPFTEERRWLKKSSEMRLQTLWYLFSLLDLKQPKIEDLPESCGGHLCETFWRGNEESLPRDEVE